MEDLRNSFDEAWSSYLKDTTQKLRMIDVFGVFIMLTGIIQFVYVALVGTFPYNSFLSGFISTVGCFVLTMNLRIQIVNSKATQSRAFADFILCNVILHLTVFNFLG